MGKLSNDLKRLGYEKTEQESPFEEGGTLWTKGFEAVCDETGIVIREGDSSFQFERETEVYRYRNSKKVKLAGGHTSSYDWGTEEKSGRFFY